MKLLQSIGAVFAGLIAVVVLSTGADYVAESTGVLPPADRASDYTNLHWGIAATYRTAFNIVGGYLAARLAPYRPITHAIVLGCIGFAAAMAGVIFTWNLIPPDTRWYPMALVVTSIPFCWLGGLLHRARAATA